ncbi:COG5499 Predicted transcription regulator containing HTH domain [Spirosomataceae bacterium]|jgi:HTH-type transcriptional regulator/antitoxin HigA
MKITIAYLNDIVLKPIISEDDFKRASEIIDNLIDADMIEEPDLKHKALNLLDAVTTLAIAYEKKHFPIPTPSPLEAIKQRMVMLNLSQKDVAKYFGGENRVSEVLNGKRNLNLKMIKKLHQNLRIPADILLS